MATYHVTLQRRRHLLATAPGDTLAGWELVETVPGEPHAVLRLPDDWSEAQRQAALAALVQRGYVRAGSARPEKQLTVLWLPGPLDAEVQWVPGDTFPGLGVTSETQRRGRWGSGVRVAVLDTDGFAGHDAFRDRDFSGDFNSNPSHSHATHVVGILAGKRSAAELFGGAPDVTLRLFNVLPGGSGSESLIASGYQRAVEWGAQVISASLGGAGQSGVINQRVQWARQQGVLCVSAAGNGASAHPVGSPASVSTYAVLASDRSQPARLASFTDGRHSQDRSLPRIAAPGVDVMSSLPGNQVGPASGTSMSCPAIAAMCCLLLAAG
jgi:hypothetical protein